MNSQLNNNLYIIISKPDCKYCEKSRKLLKSKNLKYLELKNTSEEDKLDFKTLAYTSYPQIFKIYNFPPFLRDNNSVVQWIGGFSDLENSLNADFSVDAGDEDF